MREPQFHRRYDYDRQLLPNRHLAALDDVTNLDDARATSGLSIGYPGWGLLYYTVMTTLVPGEANVIIETGTNRGSSTIILAQALQDSGVDGHVHTIEIDQETADLATENLAAAGHTERVTQYVGDAKEYLPNVLRAIDGEIRVAFLDGAHDLEDVIREFEAVHPLLTRNAIVVFDNTYRIASEGEDPRVHGALAQITHRFGGNLINFPTVSWYTPGMAIWQDHPFDVRWERLSKSGSGG